jgi:hypothetical protein
MIYSKTASKDNVLLLSRSLHVDVDSYDGNINWV